MKKLMSLIAVLMIVASMGAFATESHDSENSLCLEGRNAGDVKTTVIDSEGSDNGGVSGK
jgi:hypothetical protein